MLKETLSEMLGVSEDVCEGVTPSNSVLADVAETLLAIDLLGDGVNELDAVAVRELVPLGVGVCVGEEVGVPLPLGVAVSLLVKGALGECDGLAPEESEAVAEIDAGDVPDDVAVRVADGVPVGVEDADREVVAVLLLEGVPEGVEPIVSDAVFDGVGVPVLVGVALLEVVPVELSVDE